MQDKLISPIALLVFNRPETTKRVFEVIRAARPTKLFIVADGPRTNEEKKLTDEVRKIVDHIDWPCQVSKNYSGENMGCKLRVSSGIDWVFEQSDRAIILEDDCLPDPSFFPFCDELLERYKDDEQIMHISGDNFQATNKDFHCDASYYFTHLSHIWGWASWRRAWKHYDVDMNKWPEIKKSSLLRDLFKDEGAVARWEEKFQDYYDKKITSWDGQWSFACFANAGLCIVPRVNLVSNIGFGTSATHTVNDGRFDRFASMPTEALLFPLTHPREKIVNIQAEQFVQEYLFGAHHYRGWGQRVRRFFRKYFPRFYSILKKTRR